MVLARARAWARLPIERFPPAAWRPGRRRHARRARPEVHSGRSLARPSPRHLSLPASLRRDGRLLWSAGPLPLGFEAHGYTEVLWVYPRVIEPNSSPDLLVMHRNPFLAASPKPIMHGNRSAAQERLTRISGRTGRIVWDVPIKDQPSPQAMGIQAMPPRFADVNGDGSLDAALILMPDPQSPERNFDLKIFSLRDGTILWSRSLRQSRQGMDFPQVEISKVPSDGSSVIYVTEEPETQTTQEFLCSALTAAMAACAGPGGALKGTAITRPVAALIPSP